VPIRFLSDVHNGGVPYPKQGMLELDYVVVWPRDGMPVEPQVGVTLRRLYKGSSSVGMGGVWKIGSRIEPKMAVAGWR